ncbi:uncharacterized protein RCC_08704 [Ramularia collo-cygni]|uniref:F-box domain-containing protein n=1 Tax=Ramularia collo-cygni TaxID=112498 RepID=A0A2D3V0T3_9PEZI|nr:uncharacterized protein RCC_08704 [Ramularia collo-cygni]CZT22996.1 uncharacterized protein RCC_08704 [Ramularia collo-cygni]
MSASALQDTTSPAPLTQPIGTILFTLPRELRDQIYGYVFQSDVEEGEAVDLYCNSPPSKALCLTNKQIYDETHKLHNKAFRSYYRDTEFIIIMEAFGSYTAAWSFTPKEEANINHVNHVTIKSVIPTCGWSQLWSTYKLRLGGEIWACDPEIDLVQPRRYLEIGADISTGVVRPAISYSYSNAGGPLKPEAASDLLEHAERSRKLHGLGPAPPLVEQLQVISERAARTTRWYYRVFER